MRSKRSSNSTANLALPALLALTCLCSACSPKKSDVVAFDRASAEAKMEEKFKEDLGINPVIRSVDTTLYLYLPVEKNILAIERASDMGGGKKKSDKKDDKRDKNFTHTTCSYKDGYFDVGYATAELPAEKQFFDNITYNYTNQANTIIQKVYNLISDVLTERPNHYTFFRVVIADVKEGIEMTMTFNELDLRKEYSGAIPYYEFSRRVVTTVSGNVEVTKDYRGKHLEFKPVELPEFISDLVVQYLKSGEDLKKAPDTETAVIKRFYDVATMYDYKEFLFLRTEDVTMRKEQLYSYDQLVEKFGQK
jgi:hypothetical protein